MRPATRPLGARGEDLAARLLAESGFTIVARNYVCPQGEIDLVAEKDGRLCFVEVKLRRNLDAGHPAEAVTPAKQARLRRCALHYLQATGGERQLGFAVLAILDPGEGLPPRAELITEAF